MIGNCSELVSWYLFAFSKTFIISSEVEDEEPWCVIKQTCGKDLKYSSFESIPRKFELMRRIAKDFDDLFGIKNRLEISTRLRKKNYY